MSGTKHDYRIRSVEIGDAASRVALDQRLAEDGRGMVFTPDQVHSVDKERAQIEAHLAAPGASLDMVAAMASGRIIANAKITQFKPARCRHVGLITLGVDPDFQQQGIGRAMLETLLRQLDSQVFSRLELYVREDNQRAIRLYESLGFYIEGVRKAFIRLEDGRLVNDLIMVKFENS